MQVGGHKLELNWLVTLLTGGGDVQVTDFGAHFMALASVLAPKSQFKLASNCLQVSTNDGVSLTIQLAGTDTAAAPMVSSLRQMLVIGLAVGIGAPQPLACLAHCCA